MKRLGMRKSPVRKPELLIEADRIDDQCILPSLGAVAGLPVAHRIAVVAAHHFISLTLRTPISIYDPPVALSPARQHQNAAQLPLLDELESMRSLKLPRASWRQAAREG